MNDLSHLRVLGGNEWERAATRTYPFDSIKFHRNGLRVNLHAPRRFFGRTYYASAPFATDGPVYCDHGCVNKAALADLDSLLHETNAKYFLIKARANLFAQNAPRVVVDLSKVTYSLDTSVGASHIWKRGMNATRRNETNRALKSGMTVACGALDLLNDYWQVVSRCWRDLGTPTHSKKFYENLLIELGDSATLIVIYHEERPIAAAFTVVRGDTLHHPFAYAIKEYRKLFANSLLYWTIISRACEQGLQQFDMGRSTRMRGTSFFKESWGASPVQLYYGYLLAPGIKVPDPDSLMIKTAVRAWTRLPLGVANALGPHLIRSVL